MVVDEGSKLMDELMRLGLDQKEARVYLGVLRLGRPTARAVSDATGIGRSNVYDVLDRLAARGLVSWPERSHSNHRTAIANDPVCLLDDWERSRQGLVSLVPELRAIHEKSPGHPRIRFFEGVDGAVRVLDSLLENDKPILGIISMEDLQNYPGVEAMEAFISRRVESGQEMHAIRSRQKEVDPIWGPEPETLRELRYAPLDKVFTMTMMVNGDTVALLASRRESFALTIESQEFAGLQRHLFELLWHQSTPVESGEQPRRD